MASFINPGESEKSSDEALIAKLRRFVEESDLSLHQVATLMGTSGTILSMWIAGTAKPQQAELGEIGKFLSADNIEGPANR